MRIVLLLPVRILPRPSAPLLPAADGLAVRKPGADEAAGGATVLHRIEPDGDRDARRERRGTNPLPPQVVGAAPLHAPLGLLALFVLDDHLNPAVRVLELELLDGAGDL